MSALAQFAQAIHKAQADRDQKVLAVLAEALGCEATVVAVQAQGSRLKRYQHGDRACSFFIDDLPVVYAGNVQCSQSAVNGVVTVTATYELTDYRK